MSKAVVTAHQPSMTEWFAAIGAQAESDAFRAEDNAKAIRQEVLFRTIGLPYERPVVFPARALTDQSPEFMRYLEVHGNDLCAIRLVPTRSELPKLRQRGLPLGETYAQWYLKQTIDPDAYNANIYPHSSTLLWSATFVANEEAVFGEILRGLHSELTHGDTTSPIYQFRYDYTDWEWSAVDSEAESQITHMLGLVQVSDPAKQEELGRQLNALFSHEYLCGYFEFTVWPDGKTYLIDYNRMLLKLIPTPPAFSIQEPSSSAVIHGRCAQPGIVQGKVVIIEPEAMSTVQFSDGDILVCDNTDVRYLPFMQKAGAIVTNRGGLLTHAAIIARELKKPCIIGTLNASKVLQTGERVEVNATKGTVQKL